MATQKVPHLLEFYGTECEWCQRMQPIVKRLEKAEGIEIEKIEVWHHPENEQKMMEYVETLVLACEGDIGVPNFINTKTGEALCGAQEYDVLKSWALKK